MISYCLDLDRTLFRTDQFSRQLWRWLARATPTLDPAVELARQVEFCQLPQGPTGPRPYDLSAHLTDLGLDVRATFEQIVASELADGRFEYPGVAELIAQLRQAGSVLVLTYGVDDYQRLKAALCSSLAGVPVVTTLQSKATFLAERASGQQAVWLIDDKPLDQLPPWVRFLQVCQEGQAVDLAADWPIVQHLNEVPAVVLA